jgi:hypothetical protein
MNRFALLMLCGVASGLPLCAHADEAAAVAILRAGCAEDVQRLCAGVQPGGGRILACLKQNKDSLSDKCKQAAQQIAAMSGAPPTPPPSAPPSTEAAPAGATAAAPSSARTTKSPREASLSAGKHAVPTDDAPGAYLRMKKAQITMIFSERPNAQPQPALEMLIPTTWELKGGLPALGDIETGCFCDLAPIVWDAKSADQSIEFRSYPNYSWQYSDDPQELQKLNDPNRRARGPTGKVCPVSKPLTAEQFFREHLTRALPSGMTIVSIDPYPELNQLARRQMGLGTDDTGSGGVRTDAIRARVEYQLDNKPMEAWLTAAVVMRTYRVGGGAFYDLHAIDLMAFTAPKGKLTGNDKLLRVMMTSIKVLPAYSVVHNKNIAGYYQLQAQKEAKIDQINANLQNEITQTYMQMSANSARASRQGFLEADQGIRGVQTFRDPSTGQTMELSDQYDHAWLNGANEYVMSDDPNFNPNAQLSGSWNQLQAVRPSP